VASVLLLIGDFSEGVVHSPVIAAFMAAGYLLLMAWLIAVGTRLWPQG
jgi:hypothetical protein